MTWRELERLDSRIAASDAKDRTYELTPHPLGGPHGVSNNCVTWTRVMLTEAGIDMNPDPRRGYVWEPWNTYLYADDVNDYRGIVGQ